jgi:hypothetical protein
MKKIKKNFEMWKDYLGLSRYVQGNEKEPNIGMQENYSRKRCSYGS